MELALRHAYRSHGGLLRNIVETKTSEKWLPALRNWRRLVVNRVAFNLLCICLMHSKMPKMKVIIRPLAIVACLGFELPKCNQIYWLDGEQTGLVRFERWANANRPVSGDLPEEKQLFALNFARIVMFLIWSWCTRLVSNGNWSFAVSLA